MVSALDSGASSPGSSGPGSSGLGSSPGQGHCVVGKLNAGG